MTEEAKAAEVKPAEPKFKVCQVEATETRTCSVHGAYESQRLRVLGQLKDWQPCPKCEAALRDQEAEAEKQKMMARRMEIAGIPPRYRDKGFNDFRVEKDVGKSKALLITRSYAEDFLLHLKDGRCLMLVGEAGTGKTHLAISIVKAVIAAGFKARYSVVHEVIESIRATWRQDSPEPESAVVKRYTEPDLLVLDEVGVQYGKESEQIELFKILNRRYNAVLPTVAISNVSLDELRRFLGDRVYDRMRENGGRAVEFTWESERGR